MKTTYLNETHKKMNAKMVEFGGYNMPVWYSNMKDEHVAVRNSAGMFDVSHMGVIILTGAGSFPLLEKISCNDPEKCRNGKMIYSMALNESGGILDDIMFGQVDDARVLLVVNAGNKAKMGGWISQHAGSDVTVQPLEPTHCLIAVQGPKGAELLATALQLDLASIGRFSVTTRQWNGVELIISRTGYTGEDGFEVVVPNTHAELLWEACLTVGITPCGLASRDSLRIEAGLPLYGHELSEIITPLETRYQWVVKLNHNFIGRAAIEQKMAQPAQWTTVGIQMLDRMIPRAEYPIQEGGEVLSGTLSPLQNVAIGMARVPVNCAKIGTALSVTIRGQGHPARVVALPFK